MYKLDYEKYKQFCETATDDLGNRLPMRLTKQEEQQAILAFNKLIYGRTHSD